MYWLPLHLFAALLIFFHTTEFFLAWRYMREELSFTCVSLASFPKTTSAELQWLRQLLCCSMPLEWTLLHRNGLRAA